MEGKKEKGKRKEKKEKNSNRTQRRTRMGRPNLGRTILNTDYLPHCVPNKALQLRGQEIKGLASLGRSTRGPCTEFCIKLFLFVADGRRKI